MCEVIIDFVYKRQKFFSTGEIYRTNACPYNILWNLKLQNCQILVQKIDTLLVQIMDCVGIR